MILLDPVTQVFILANFNRFDLTPGTIPQTLCDVTGNDSLVAGLGTTNNNAFVSTVSPTLSICHLQIMRTQTAGQIPAHAKQDHRRGYLVAEVSKRLGVSQHALYAWKKKFSTPFISGSEDQAAQIRRLKREPTRITEERDRVYRCLKLHCAAW